MKRKSLTGGFLLIAVLIIGVVIGTERIQAENNLTEEEIAKKLDEVLNNQAEILKQLEEMRKELYIIKIRASQ